MRNSHFINIDFSFYEQRGFFLCVCLQCHRFSIIAQILKIQTRFCTRTSLIYITITMYSDATILEA